MPHVLPMMRFIKCHTYLVEGGMAMMKVALWPSQRLCISPQTRCTIELAKRRIVSMEQQGIVPAVIVGGGRVGSALEKMGAGKDTVVRRGEKVPPLSSGPIFVCTRNDVLEAVLEATPPNRWQDLVFFQNGMLEPWLERKGIPDASQVLVYFAIAKLGDIPIDGKTDTNPEGLTAASGKWAPAVAARLHSAGLSCQVLSPEEFQKPMLEKLIWISAFMLVGARHPGSTVGVVEKDYSNEVIALIKELADAASAAKGVTFDAGIEARLCAYARSVAHFPTALKEFEWRNGWFYALSENAIKSGLTDPCPLHTSWLKELGAVQGKAQDTVDESSSGVPEDCCSTDGGKGTNDVSSMASPTKTTNRVIALASAAAAVGLFLATRGGFSGATLGELAATALPYEEALSNGRPTVVEFYADWCEVCREMAPDVYKVEQQYKDVVNFVMLNVDNTKWEQELDEFGVEGIPHFAFLDKQGNEEGNIVGKLPKKYLEDNVLALSKGEDKLPHSRVVGQFSKPELHQAPVMAEPRSHGT